MPPFAQYALILIAAVPLFCYLLAVTVGIL